MDTSEKNGPGNQEPANSSARREFFLQASALSAGMAITTYMKATGLPVDKINSHSLAD